MSSSIGPKQAIATSATCFERYRSPCRTFSIALTIILALSAILAHFLNVGGVPCVSCLSVGSGLFLIGALISFYPFSNKPQKKPVAIPETKISKLPVQHRDSPKISTAPKKKSEPVQTSDSPQKIPPPQKNESLKKNEPSQNNDELRNMKLSYGSSRFWDESSDDKKEIAKKAWEMNKLKNPSSTNALRFMIPWIIINEVETLLICEKKDSNVQQSFDRLLPYINLHKYNYFVANVILSCLKEQHSDLYALVVSKTDLFTIHPLLKQEMEES